MTTALVRPYEKVAPYPWDTMPKVPREAVTVLPAVRRALRRVFDAEAWALSLGEMVRAPMRVGARAIELHRGPELPSLHGAAFVLATSDGRWRIGVELERALVGALLGRLLRREVGLLDPSRPIEADLVGAVAALVATAARRSHEIALVPAGMGQLRVDPGERVAVVHQTLLMDSEAFAASVTLPLPVPTSLADSFDAGATLPGLCHLPLELPLVVAASIADRSELAAIAVGDVWFPGEGWMLGCEGEALVGRAWLMAPASERGIAVALREDGSLLVEGTATSSWEEVAMHENEGEAKTAAEAVLDAPVVVRVDMGAVTLSAREWARLAPGDVIALGKRVAEPVVLRVAGVEVARGELVDVEGELGVRILSTVSGQG